MLRTLLSRPFIPLLVMLAICFTIPKNFQIGFILITFFIFSATFIYIKIKFGASHYWLFGISIIATLFIIRKNTHQLNEHPENMESILSCHQQEFIIEAYELIESRNKLICQFYHQNKWVNAQITFPLIDPNLNIKIGQKILFTGSLKRILIRDELESFNYSTYLDRQHILYTGFAKEFLLTNEKPNFSIYGIANQCNVSIQGQILTYVQDSSLAHLLIAVLLGDKSKVDQKIQEQFISTGTAHILAVSGMHIGILYTILNTLMSFFSSRIKILKKIQSPLILLIIWAFAFISGLGSSVLRSAVMFSFYTVGIKLKKISDPANTICGSAFLMIFYNPCMIYDIGFQLSFFAVLSIILFYPFFKRLLVTSNKIQNYFLDIINVSMAVQFLITPISIYYFQTFPTYFLISNIVWVPISFLLMVTGLGLLGFSYFWPFISQLFASITSLCLNFGLKVFDFIESLPYHQLLDIILFPEQLILLLLGVLSIYYWIYFSNKKFLAFGLCIIILSNLIPWIRYAISDTALEVITYKQKNAPILDLHFDHQIISLADSSYQIDQKTYFQKLFYLEQRQTKYLSGNNNISVQFQSSKNKLQINVDTLLKFQNFCNYLFILHRKFKAEELCQYEFQNIYILSKASYDVKKYYSNIKYLLQTQITQLEYHNTKLIL